MATSVTNSRHPLESGLVGAAAIVALYVVMALPYFLWPFDPQPDERRYSIAAAQMMVSGDYIVPKSETGELRLTKPPLTYYYVVAGFALLGETLSGAKLFFLISAAGIVFLVYALGRALGASVLTATLGAAMMAGHRLFFTTSTQYIPDMPLVLGTTAALLGFVHVLSGTSRPWHFYLAWLGIAWAVLAKGFLAPLLLLVYAVARWLPGAALIEPRLRRHEALAAALAVLVVAPWFVFTWLWHSDVLIAQFVGDQVAGKIKIDALTVLNGIRKTTSALFLLALPGFLALVLARIAAGRRVAIRSLPGPASVFLLAWIAINIVIYAFSHKIYGRYALPAAPALMALAAAYANLLPAEALATGLRRTMRILLPLLAVTALVGALIGLLFGAVRWGVVGLIGTIVGLPMLWRALSTRPFVAGISAAALFFPGIELARLPATYALTWPTEGQVAAKRIADLDPSDRVLIVNRNAQLVDRIGVELGDFARLRFAVTLPEAPEAEMVVFYDAALRTPLRQAGYRIDSTPVIRKLSIEPEKVASFLAQRDAAALREAIGVPLFFATKP